MAMSVTVPRIIVHVIAPVSAAAIRMLFVTAAVSTVIAMAGTCGNNHGTKGQTGSHRQHGGRKLFHRFLV